MAQYTVRTGHVERDEEVQIVAHYYVQDEGFTTFKGADHKQVASFNDGFLISIIKTA